jgi:hypothetical protein
LPGHSTKILCLGKFRKVRMLPGTASSLGRGKRHIGIAPPYDRGRLYGHDIGQLAFPQLLPKIKVLAIKGIGHDRQPRHFPVQHLINELKGQLRLPLMGHVGRCFDLCHSLGIIHPFLWQIQAPPQRATSLPSAPMQGNSNLAVGHLSQCPTVLTGHSHRVAPGFGERRVVQNPYLRLTEKIDNLPRQAPLDLLYSPGTLPNKLPKGLDLSASDPVRYGFNGLAFPIQQKALNVELSPMPTFAAAHGGQQIPKERVQPSIKCFQFLRSHVRSIHSPQENVNNYLT